MLGSQDVRRVCGTGKGAAAGEAAEYDAKVRELLQKKGRVTVAALGGFVKRPPSIPKLKKYIEDHKAFKIDAAMNVTLA